MEGVTLLSGNTIVDEISQLRINSIPDCWYHNIKKNGQTQAMAILVLWDLLYWYKWTELRDEHTGLITGYKKKFAADLLQRSYSDIGAKFGITKRQATDVISFLADLGVLKKHLRTISFKNGLRCNNVLFIELIPSKIKEISNEKTAPVYTPTGTDESYTVEEEEISRNDVTPSHEKTSDLYTSKRETNTTNTTITSTNNSTTNTTSKNFEQEENNNNQESKSHCCGSTATKNNKKRVSKPKPLSKSQQAQEFLNTLSEKEQEDYKECARVFYNFKKSIRDTFETSEATLICWQSNFAKCAEEFNVSSSEILNTLIFAISSDYWKQYMFSPDNFRKSFEKLYQQKTYSNQKSNTSSYKPKQNFMATEKYSLGDILGDC